MRTILLFALLGAVAAPQIAPDLELVEDRGGWTPPADLLARAAALGRLAAAQLEAVVRRIEQDEGKAARIRVCRAGLRLKDRVAARAAATRLFWEELDHWEIERVIALCLDDFARPGTLVDFEKLRSMIGGKELFTIFGSFPSPPWNQSATYYLSELHRQVKAEHIPVLCRLARHPNAAVREQAWGNVVLVLVRTDRHLRQAARTLLAMEGFGDLAGPSPEPESPAAAREGGLPRSLVTIIRRFWMDPKLGPAGWEMRWLLRARPSHADAPHLVAAYGAAAASKARPVLVRALRHLDDEATRALLRRVVTEKGDHELVTLARGALAFRGDGEARTALQKAARSDPLALSVLFEASPDAAAHALRERVLQCPPEAALAALETLSDAMSDSRHRFLIRWPDTVFEGFEGAALTAPVSGLVLAEIGVTVPGCRTPRLAEAVVERLKADGLAALLRTEDARVALDRVFPFLETAAPEGFRKRLRAWAGSAEPSVRRCALATLLAIGDPESGERLVEWLGDDPDSAAESDVNRMAKHSREMEVVLARSRSGAVRRYLEKRAAAEAAHAEARGGHPAHQGLAVLDGVPPWTARLVVARLEDGGRPGRLARLALIREGRALAALDDCLARPPGSADSVDIPPDLWRIDRPSVRAFLKRLRREREHGLYAWATAHLACLGDPAARTESEAVMRAGRYRWMDEVFSEPDLATFGYDLKRTVPFWIDELESNCCRHCVAANVLDDLFPGHDLYMAGSDDFRATSADMMRRWWRRHENARWVWSRLLEQFVPVF